MNRRMMLQAGPARANELFAKLLDTSDDALNSRGKVFAELKGELELHAGLEEEHLFPILRKSPETRALVADAIRDNKEMRAMIAELEARPKNDETFPARLGELRKAFRHHARDERNELLPAVQRALGHKVEAGPAEAVQDEAEEQRALEQVRLAAEAAERALQERMAAEERAHEATRAAADAAGSAAEAGAEVARQVARLVTPDSVARRDAARAPRPAVRTDMTSMFFWPWLGAPSSGRAVQGPARTTAPRSAEEVIPLGEEVLEVGKRTVARGTVQVRRYVVETVAEQQVTLYSERVVVERRRPATDRITGEILTDLTVELVETAEVPMVEKHARLREEIVLRTERTQHVETVRETLRRDEVEIRQPRVQALAAMRAPE